MNIIAILFILSATWVFGSEGLISPDPSLIKEKITKGNLFNLLKKNNKTYTFSKST